MFANTDRLSLPPTKSSFLHHNPRSDGFCMLPSNNRLLVVLLLSSATNALDQVHIPLQRTNLNSFLSYLLLNSLHFLSIPPTAIGFRIRVQSTQLEMTLKVAGETDTRKGRKEAEHSKGGQLGVPLSVGGGNDKRKHDFVISFKDTADT